MVREAGQPLVYFFPQDESWILFFPSCMQVRNGAYAHVHQNLVLATRRWRRPIRRTEQQLQLHQHGRVGNSHSEFPEH